MSSQKLKGKVAVITGAGGVLCSAMAEEVARHGAKVALLGRRKESVQTVAERISQAGGQAMGIEANVLQVESLKKAKTIINEQLGPCDILINGAGGNSPKGNTSTTHFNLGDETKEELTTFFDLDLDGISYVFNLNFLGTLLPTQVFAKDMIGREGCSIINISSMSAFKPLTKIPAYSGAKAAVSNFTQWLAVHFAKVNIRVNALVPGFFLTEQNRMLLTNEHGELTPRGHTIIEHTPMGRFGKPEDLMGTLIWLCTQDSAFVTGVSIPVDGGFSAYSGV